MLNLHHLHHNSQPQHIATHQHSPDLPLGTRGDLGARGDLGGDIVGVCLGVFLGACPTAGEGEGECLFFGGDFDLSMLLFCESLLPLSSLLLPASSD